MRYVYLLVLTASLVYGQDGATIYKERCSSCHDSAAARVPPLSAIKQMSAESIYVALTNGVMKTQAQGLSTPQILMLIGYIAPTGGRHADETTSFAPTCKGAAAFHPGTNTPGTNTQEWNGWSPGLTNSRFQSAAAAGLTDTTVPKLKLKWAFNLGDVTIARSQPVIVGGWIFVTTQTGSVYALDANTGCTHWGFQAGPAIRSGVTIGVANGDPAVFFADGGADLYALNATTGKQIWKVQASDQFATLPTATPRYFKGVIYEPFASFEESLAADPKYNCCKFRGSVVALDANTGKTIWQTFTIPDAPMPTGKNIAGTQTFGPSGASVWSSVTIDEQTNALYIATGDNYSDPPTNTSDAVLALDMKTGKMLWSRQLTANDAFNNGCSIPVPGNCPEVHGSDYDFGQSPILVRLSNGKRALVIGQKSGMVHAIDPDQKGSILWQTRVGEGSALGGSQWGSAADAKNVYVAISDLGIGGVPDPKSPLGFRLTLDPKKGGGLYAVDLATGKIQWSAKPTPCAATRTDCSPAQSAAVTAIPGVVFSGSADGHLRAYSTSTGEVLWDTDTEREFDTVNGKPAHGGSMDAAGPAIVNGMAFVNSGYGQWGGMPGNVLLAFSAQ